MDWFDDNDIAIKPLLNHLHELHVDKVENKNQRLINRNLEDIIQNDKNYSKAFMCLILKHKDKPEPLVPSFFQLALKVEENLKEQFYIYLKENVIKSVFGYVSNNTIISFF